MQIETNLTSDLHEWGKWANACPSRSLNYPSEQPFTKMMRDKFTIEGGAGLNITDDWAVELDQTIALLFSDDKEVIKLFKLYFVCGFTYRDIERYTEIKRSYAQRTIENSVNWLTGYMVGKRAA
tara:strand:- start:23845 stop:24216 length:372 start_codon:yes stop_codon:yes gene_type:complete